MKTDDKGHLLLIPLTDEVESDTEWREVEGPTPCSPLLCAIDFETYYSNSYSLSKMTAWEYVNHSAFDAYMVALERWDERVGSWMRWVGHPSKAPWVDIMDHIWISHNAAFDELVYWRLKQLGELPPSLGDPPQWNCSADLTIWLQAGRSLKESAKNLLGIELDKSTVELMKGGGVAGEEMRDYAATDAKICAWIWCKFSPKWPERERAMSAITRRAGWRGIHIDLPAVEYGIAHLEQVKAKIRQDLPWGHKGPISSLKQFAIECGRHGVESPLSIAEDDESSRRWEKKHGKRFNWIRQIRRYTKANLTQTSLKVLRDRCRADQTVPFVLVYCKATHTKRWQHAGGLRIQNLDKWPCEGVEIRHTITPRPGHKFVIADLSQIEPRVLAYNAGDEKFLDYCRRGISPYEAHARSTMGYNVDAPLKSENPTLYALAKARLLALGYQSGAENFVEMAWTLARLTIDLTQQTILLPEGGTITQSKMNAEICDCSPLGQQLLGMMNRKELNVLPSAQSAVQDFRRNNPLITSYWRRMENEVRSKHGGFCKIDLLSGSHLRYFDIDTSGKEIRVSVIKGNRKGNNLKYLYGGKIVENITQGFSREVFCDCLYRVSLLPPELGIHPLFHVHDEGIWEVPTEKAQNCFDAIMKEMNASPVWAAGLPVAAEGEITDHYKK